MDQSDKNKNQAEGSNHLTDFLTAPRKKRKNYVIIALPKSMDGEFALTVENYIKKNYPHLSVSRPRTMPELTRQFGRNIALLLISDEFEPAGDKKITEVIRALKEKRRNEIIPVLFVTRNPSQLVNDYHHELLAFHETDEYVEFPPSNRQQLFGRIKNGIETKNQRKGRRYKVDLDTSFFVLSKDQIFKGQILDLSIFGALLEAEPGCIFRMGDQLRLSIPINGILPSGQGDFLKVSARVRRVFISGTLAGISFEHMSASQAQKLTKLLTLLVNRDMGRKAAKFKLPSDMTFKKES